MKEPLQKKKFTIKDVLNVRPLVVAAAAQILGIASMKNGLYVLGIAALFVVVVYALAFCGEKSERKFFCLVTAFFFAFGFLCAVGQSAYFSSGEEEVSGVMSGHVAFVERGGYTYLKNVFVGDKYLGNAVMETYYDLYVGEDVVFYGTATKRDIFGYYGVSSKLLQFSAKYSIVADGFSSFGYNPSVDETIREFFRAELYRGMSYDSAAICYGMMFGDTSNITSETLETMRVSGIAHVFAVSGLHVGVLYSIINKLFGNRARKARLFIVPVLLFGYAYVSGNSPSSLRAATMFSVVNAANCLYKHKDKPSVLAFAAIVVFTLSPFSVYSKGCILSFAVVATLMLFGRSDKAEEKKRNAFSDSVRTSLVANVGSLPLLSCFFGYISFISLPLNIIIVPLVGIVYTYTFFALPLSALFGVNLLRITDVALIATKSVCELFYSLGTVVKVSFSALTVAIYYIALFVLSKYCFLSKKAKVITFIVLAAAFCLSFLSV